MTAPRYLFFFALIMLSSAVVSHRAGAADLTPQEVAQRIQQTYAKTRTLRAEFQQTTSSRMSDRERHGAGSMVLAKPGLMRWDYREPDQQVFVCDGKRISMYFAKERQMMVTPAKDYLESDVTYSFFTGKGDIARDFLVAGPEEEDLAEANPAYQLKLTPKQPHAQIDFINIWVDRNTFLLKKLKVTDKFGTVTDLVFSQVSVNEDVADMIFHFTPPEGTEIIDK